MLPDLTPNQRYRFVTFISLAMILPSFLAFVPTGAAETGTDMDRDGWFTPHDCDDELAYVHPSMPEATSGGVDDDCDGIRDEDNSAVSPGVFSAIRSTVSAGDTFTLDGFGFQNTEYVRFASSSTYHYALAEFTVLSDGKLNVIVPSDVVSDNQYTVEVVSGQTDSTGTFNRATGVIFTILVNPVGTPELSIASVSKTTNDGQLVFNVETDNRQGTGMASHFNLLLQPSWAPNAELVAMSRLEAGIHPTLFFLGGTFPAPPEGCNSLHVTIDSKGAVPELNEDNNVFLYKFVHGSGSCDDTATKPALPEAVPFSANLTAELVFEANGNPAAAFDDAMFGLDATATTGYDEGLDTAEPPAPAGANWARAGFHYLDQVPAQLNVSVYDTTTSAHEWPLFVQSSANANDRGDTVAPHDVRLSWNTGDFSKLLPEFEVFLLSNTGEFLANMGTQSSYVYSQAGGELILEGGAIEFFTIRLEPTTPDLSIVSHVITSFDGVNSDIVENHPATFEVTVKNIAHVKSTSATLNLYLDDGMTPVAHAPVPALVPDGETVVTFQWTPEVRDQHFLSLVIEGTEPAERWERLANNVLELTVNIIDYEVDATGTGESHRTFAPGETHTYTATITNTGNVETKFDVSAEAFVTASTSTGTWSVTVSDPQPMIAPGGVLDVTITVTAPASSSQYGDHAGIALTVQSVRDATASDWASFSARLLPTITMSFDAGWHLVSVPVDTRSNVPLEVFHGADAVFEWTGSGYVAATEVSPTYGYWVYFNQETKIDFVGELILSIPTTFIDAGWHLVGGPSHNDAPVTLPSTGIQRYLYGYDNVAGGYDVIGDSKDEPFVTDYGRGYWIFVDQPGAEAVFG